MVSSSKQVHPKTAVAAIQRFLMRLARVPWSYPLQERARGDVAGYLRRAVHRRDWNDAVRVGLVKAREVQAAHVIAIQEFVRECSNRTGEGLPRQIFEPARKPGPIVVGPACPVKRLPYIEPDEDAPVEPKKPWEPPCSYEGDHGQSNWSNGAILADDDLSWYYGASALELGLSSSFDAMVTQLLIGGVNGNRSDPGGPSPRMLAAASRQIRIRRTLRKLSPKMQAVLEAAYTDRRYKVQDLARTEPGAGALIWHAEQEQRDLQESPRGAALAALQRLLMAASGTGRRRVPAWSPLELELHAATGSFKDRVARGAAGLVLRAQRAYDAAAEDDRNDRGPDRGGKKRRRGAPLLIAAGTAGTSRRKLVEAPRKRAAA